MRTFLAVDISDGIRARLSDEIGRLEGQVPPNSVRWVRPETIHLTLKFLGEVEPGRLEEVKVSVRPAAQEAARFQLAVVGLGAFPHRDNPRVIWVGVEDGSGELAALHQRLEDALEELGFDRERHDFTAHLTLGRVRRGLGGRARRELKEAVRSAQVGALGQMEAEELVLYHSDLRPGGAVYTPLEVFTFGAG